MARAKKTKAAGGPYLAAAVFCDSVLKGDDGVMSAVRIVDRVTVTIPADSPPDVPSDEKMLLCNIQGLVSFKKGYAGIKHDLKLVMNSPSGKTDIMQHRIEFIDVAHGGHNLRVNLQMAVSEGGLFWMDVYLDGKLMTRMPLLIAVKRAEAVSADGPPAKKGLAKPRTRRAK
jgi:uncharacterized protein DUF6941